MIWAAYSIASKSHFPQVKTMAESLWQHHPETQIHVLLIDDLNITGLGLNDSRFVLTPVEQIMPKDQLNKLYFEYNAFQLSCIFKSVFAKHLFEKSKTQNLIYMDADLYFKAPIDDFLTELNSANFLTTPHLVEPNLQATRKEIFKEAQANSAGIFNLGFYGLRKSKETNKFLDWWYDRTSANCRRDLANGFYDDQNWINAAPVLFEGIKVFKNPTYNVSNWNLLERKLSLKNKTYLVSGQPLVFFHFSQMNPEQSLFLTDYLDIRIDSNPALSSLYKEYQAQLLENGYVKARQSGFSKILAL